MYRLGVDLGTTFTAAAVVRADGRAEAVTLGGSGIAVPSVLYIGDDGLVVGEVAERRSATEPTAVVREFKRRVGDPAPMLVRTSPMAAELLMARLLEWVVERVAAAEGGQPEQVIVTHPANWGAYKLDLFSQALTHVGLDGHRLVTEPVAAATFYASQQRLEPGAAVAVYDLGGGTFDAAVVRAVDAGFEIIGRPEGIERLGGADFDYAVFQHVVRTVGVDLEAPEFVAQPGAATAVAHLRRECVAAKEALSAETDVTIPVALPGGYHEVRLTRGEFEEMVAPALNETLAALQRAVEGAGLGPDDLTAVLLVGGSSRIPLVGQLVAGELGSPVAVDARPKDAVCLGAALNGVDIDRGAGPGDGILTGQGAVGAGAIGGRSGEDSGEGVAGADGPDEADSPEPDGWAARPLSGAGALVRRPSVVAAAVAGVLLVGLVAWLLLADRGGGDGGLEAGATGETTADAAGTEEDEAGGAASDVDGTEGGGDEGEAAAAGALLLSSMSAGPDHTCGVLVEGRVACWGSDEFDQLEGPDGDYLSVAAGWQHTCAVRTDRQLACWGNDEDDRTEHPDIEYRSVGAGSRHACGLRLDRAVACWGGDALGQVSTAPEDDEFDLLSVRADHACGIRTDGTLACWGDDGAGQSSPPEGEYRWVAAGGSFACGVHVGGSMECWGDDEFGQTSETPDGEFRSVSAGGGFACGVHVGGRMECWGDDEFGQVSEVPDGEFRSVAVGRAQACGVRTGGAVDCWGEDTDGQASPPGGQS